MKEFPLILDVKEKERFIDIYYNRVLCYLRKAIYEHVISHDENSYFDLEQFGRDHYKDNKDREKTISKLSESIIPELEKRNWKCKLSFGGTALFIYSTDKPPPSCWDDGF
tara:strand:- start:137 stop:466 length:330 start_codon:yes stop_codon:yes gene_type:complete